ncbi:MULTISPECIES: ATP-binding protein [Actinomadura]|uniref:ATP-binding protein n=1 Tax=Actinomadura yumaensis TaxID=111807 RepID=A0ABW2CNX0_9ACTN|nr:ATP-binding protein [Actinomadura sp. J1-007]MWK36798.1 hypothetical protein [Actinomadura sp. J1-007]
MAEAAHGEIVVKRDLEAVSEVRRHVRLMLGRWGMDDYVPCLVASELVTNAIRYVHHGEVTVRMGRTEEGEVWLEVQDAGLEMPGVREAALTSESGRGLFVVERLARCWGVRPLAGDAGKVVFAVLKP